MPEGRGDKQLTGLLLCGREWEVGKRNGELECRGHHHYHCAGCVFPASVSPATRTAPSCSWTLMSDQGQGYLQSPAQHESTLPVHGKKEEGRGAVGSLPAANLKGSPGECGGKGDTPKSHPV